MQPFCGKTACKSELSEEMLMNEVRSTVLVIIIVNMDGRQNYLQSVGLSAHQVLDAMEEQNQRC